MMVGIDVNAIELGLAAFAGAFMTHLVWWRIRVRNRARAAQSEAPSVPMSEFMHLLEDLEERFARRLDAQHEQTAEKIANIARDITFVQADLEWLSSEHMISQAIDLARHGGDSGDIARATGIGESDIRALQKLRRH